MNGPSRTGPNGRDRLGRFGYGNKFARGNPYAKRTARLRAALFRAVDPAAMLRAARKLVEQAEEGDRFAFAELLDRTIGRTVPTDIEARLQRLEEILERIEQECNHEPD